MNIGCLARAIFLCALAPRVSFSLTIDVSDETIGTTPRYIGANEGGQFSAAYMADCGINAYRLFADMNRLEPADDDGAYGSPSIAAIRADPSIIDWTIWDAAFADAARWGYAPGFGGCIEDLTAHGIEPVVCLRNRDPDGNPAWAPPQNDWDEADWNEWWEFCFSVAYWCNVRRGCGVERFEILNEPDLPAQGWSGSRAQYAELVAKAADAIRFANGLAGVPAVIHAPAVADYASPYLHDALGVSDASVDAADCHTYADTVGPAVAHVRDDVEACDTDAVVEPVWVTEWGTCTGSYNTLARADLTCRQLYDFTAAGVEGLCVFPFFDRGGFSGLVTGAGAKTETYYAYRLMCKGLSGAREILAVSSSNPVKRVVATRGGGCICVIAVDAGETVAVNLAGTGVEAGRYAVYEYSSARKDAIASSGSLSGGAFSFAVPASGAACAVVHPDTANRGFAVAAWMPTSWDFENARNSFTANLDVLTEVSPEWYKLAQDDGSIARYDNSPPDPDGVAIVSDAHAHGILVLPMIGNYDNGGFQAARVRAVITDRVSAANHVNAILNESALYGYDGIDIDYESLDASDRDAFSAFILRLGTALHARGKLLSIAVHAKESEPGTWNGPQAQDYFRLGCAVDRFRVMAYDYSWSTSPAGPIAPLPWVDSVLSFTGTVVPRAKTQLGVPFYGYDWINQKGASVTWQDVQDIIAASSPAVQWNATWKEPWFQYTSQHKQHEVWFQDASSIAWKLDEALSRHVGGMAIWRLGGEDPGNWAAMRAEDGDADGLTLPQENACGTDPTLADTDGGGTGDGGELLDGTDPLDGGDDLDGDWDGDGLTSREEQTIYFTDPYDADPDGDGLTDAEEVLVYHTAPGDADTDGDGWADCIEALCGWDLGAGAPPGTIRITFGPAQAADAPGFAHDHGTGAGARGYGWL